MRGNYRRVMWLWIAWLMMARSQSSSKRRAVCKQHLLPSKVDVILIQYAAEGSVAFILSNWVARSIS